MTPTPRAIEGVAALCIASLPAASLLVARYFRQRSAPAYARLRARQQQRSRSRVSTTTIEGRDPSYRIVGEPAQSDALRGWASRLGFAILVAILTVTYFVANLPSPPTAWRGVGEYIKAFEVTQILWMVAAFGLVLAFVVLVGCITSARPITKRASH